MELSLSSSQCHCLDLVNRKLVKMFLIYFDEEVSSSFVLLGHSQVRSSCLRKISEGEHVHGTILLGDIVQSQPECGHPHGPERPVGAVLVPGYLNTLSWQLAQDPAAEQSQSR